MLVCLFFCARFLANIGMKAEDIAPRTITSKIKSGSWKAAKYVSSSPGVKKWTKRRCLISPKILEVAIINMITVAAERIVFCFA